MIDLVFDLGGETPPTSYPFALWEELLRHAPQLSEVQNVGILPLRLSESSNGTLLPKRTRLVIRLPEILTEQITVLLSDKQIEVDGKRLQLGYGKKRVIQSYPTIHAQMVAGASDEVTFMNDIASQLKELGVVGNLICGKRHTLVGRQKSVNGFSLVIHDLKAESSLKLQYAGLGDSRKFGCGIFVPYKVISGLSDE